MVDPAIGRALAQAAASVTEATRELLFELFDAKHLDPRQRDALSTIAERATSMRLARVVSSTHPPAADLGDNWFQCPHCAEVFEGEAATCKACREPLAAARSTVELELGDARLWLCTRSPAGESTSGRTPGVERLAWMRVEAGPRWFELLDEAARARAGDTLPFTTSIPPNVSAVGVRDGDRTFLVHDSRLDVHVVERGVARADGDRKSATELAVRELTAVLYPAGEPPPPPSGRVLAQRGHATNPALEQAIATDPDRPEAYLVYADWLQGKGDPRGELIVFQHGGREDQARQLLETHASHFYGRSVNHRHLLQAHSRPLGRDTAWRWGFLERLWISNKRTRERTRHDVVDVLAALLDHPSCRFLRELTVGIVSYDDNSYEAIARVLGERELRVLRSLVLGDFHGEETELNWSHMGDLSPLYRGVPALRSLTLRSGSMQLGPIHLPRLERLDIITGGFDPESLASICDAAWPELRSLSIQLGDEHAFTLAHLAPILDARRFPKVTHLGLGNSNISDEICRGLAGSAIAAQLVSLDLSMGTLGDDGARALAAGRFPRLESIDVGHSFLTDEGVAVLRGIAGEVIVEEQDSDDGDVENRYISARE